MSFPSFLSSVLQRAGLCAVLVLLAGCATTFPVAVEVTSPPTPRHGSEPIVAYDAYAFALFSPATANEIATAQAARLTAESIPAPGLQGPVTTAEASLN